MKQKNTLDKKKKKEVKYTTVMQNQLNELKVYPGRTNKDPGWVEECDKNGNLLTDVEYMPRMGPISPATRLTVYSIDKETSAFSCKITDQEAIRILAQMVERCQPSAKTKLVRRTIKRTVMKTPTLSFMKTP